MRIQLWVRWAIRGGRSHSALGWNPHQHYAEVWAGLHPYIPLAWTSGRTSQGCHHWRGPSPRRSSTDAAAAALRGRREEANRGHHGAFPISARTCAARGSRGKGGLLPSLRGSVKSREPGAWRLTPVPAGAVSPLNRRCPEDGPAW